MKKSLNILMIVAALGVIAAELFIECHFILKMVGLVLGTLTVIEGVLSLKHIEHGYILRWKSFWLGLHYSDYNKRYCLNILPGVTLWWVGKGGHAPRELL